MSLLVKYKNLLLVGFILLLIILSIVLLVIRNNIEKDEPQTDTENAQQLVEEPVQSIPKPQFSEWIESDTVVFAKATPKNTSNRYIFKTTFTQAEITRLSTLFNATEEYTQSGELHLYASLTDDKSILLFNDKNGSMSYISEEGIAPSTNTQAPIEEQLFSFLRNAGIYDDSLRIVSTYKNTDYEGLTFYEIHRDWDIIGYSILNPIGILNIQEKDLLHELTFFFKDDRSAPDPSIVQASDGKNGLARLDDFNTITIGVDETTGNIISLKSNMRPLLVNTAYSSSQLLTREEALQSLNEGNYNFFISQPAGSGTVSLSKVYPQNIAQGKTAVIDEVMLVYLEKPPVMDQNAFEPYYLFRGYSELDSGYRITFYAAVSAIKGLTDDMVVFSQSGTPKVAAAVTQIPSDPSQKQGTLEFPTAAPTATPTITPIVTVTPPPSATVPPSPGITTTVTPTMPQTSITRGPTPPSISNCEDEIKNLVNVTTYEGVQFGKDPVTDDWYYIFDSDQSHQDIVAKLEEYISLFRRFMSAISSNLVRETRFLENELSLAHRGYKEGCTFRISGISPSIFLYGTYGSQFTVDVNQPLTYSDPPKGSQWDITILSDRLAVNNVARPYIYYEYEPVEYVKPQKGWIVRQDNLASFTKKMSTELRLTQTEEKRLLEELYIALGTQQHKTVFIGLISEDEINQKVPLYILPQINNIKRLHFYIAPATKGDRVSAPLLSPIIRSEEMVLELGAVFGK